jgi:hypothetical protein
MEVEIVFKFVTGDELWKKVMTDEVPNIFEQWFNEKRFINYSGGLLYKVNSKGEQTIKEIRILNPLIKG